jgi:hypothetical protein
MILINYWAVIVAAAASFVLGGLWYGPLFGKQWMLWSGVSMDKLNDGKKGGMAKSYILMFVGSLITAYVLGHIVLFGNAYLAAAGISAGIMAGFWVWLGFAAPITLSSVLWEMKPWKLWLLNNGYYIVSLMIMGVILSVWQ